MNSLQQTDSSAFEKLVDWYGKSIYTASFQILRNSQDAEDAVQETFLKAFEAIDGFRGDSSLYTWLYRIAQNQSLMKLRKRSRAVTVSLDAWTAASGGEQGSLPPAHWLRCENPDPGLSLHTRQLSEFIRDCIQELPDNYRQACLLKEGKSLSEDQVCRRLGISKPSMESRVHRARVRDHFQTKWQLKRSPGTEMGLQRSGPNGPPFVWSIISGIPIPEPLPVPPLALAVLG